MRDNNNNNIHRFQQNESSILRFVLWVFRYPFTNQLQKRFSGNFIFIRLVALTRRVNLPLLLDASHCPF